MSTWTACVALLPYLGGIGGVGYLKGHYLPELREENPSLAFATATRPAAIALLLALVIIAWPITIPLAIHNSTKSGDPS